VSPVYKFSNVGGFLTKNLYTSALAGNPFTPLITDFGSYFPLGEFTLSAPQATVVFDNIPQTYKHLHLRITAQGSAAVSTVDNYALWFNNVSSSGNYASRSVNGNGSTISAAGYPNLTNTSASIFIPGANRTNMFGASITDIFDYSNTSKFTTVRSLTGADVNGAGNIVYSSASFLRTEAVTSVTCLTNFNTNSTFALYGVL
jgi:hypothetical protein